MQMLTFGEIIPATDGITVGQFIKERELVSDHPRLSAYATEI